MKIDRGPYTTDAGPRRKWSTFTIWAEDGLIFLEDPDAKAEKGEHPLEVLTCRQARGRLGSWAIEEMQDLDKKRTAAVDPQEKAHHTDMFWKIKKMAEILDETIREAKNQGDQDDPEVALQKMREFMRSKLAGTYGSRLPTLQQYLSHMRGTVPDPRISSGYRRKI